MSRYIHHVTLTTGHTRRSWRHEVSLEAITLAADLIESAMDQRLRGKTIIPALVPQCHLSATAEGRCLIMTMWGPSTGDGFAVPLVTLGVATHARCGAKLWPMLHDHATVPVQTRRAERAPEPWCAVRIEPGAALYAPPHPLLPAVAELERCLAWAWIERVRHCERCERYVATIDNGETCAHCNLVL